jgi:hypothetical protein
MGLERMIYEHALNAKMFLSYVRLYLIVLLVIFDAHAHFDILRVSHDTRDCQQPLFVA